MNEGRFALIDFLIATAIALLAAVAVIGLVASHRPAWFPAAATAALAVVALSLAIARIATRPDHLRAMQSHVILEIANESLPHLRKGLDQESAQEVCRIALRQSEAAAVAITDTESVLGFAGIGEDHHEVGGPIITKATIDALASDETRILGSKDEIGCPEKDCQLRAAIVVPLEQRGAVVGTLKFYYTTPKLLNETQTTMAEGLAKLLSTQLELSELDRQTQLATSMELKALQAQINPHFLFNTINTIAALIRTDPPRARELLREFAIFYRRTLENATELVSLERELEYVAMYVHFEQARFGERLRFAEKVDDDLFDLRVPAFLLQPIVENSVQHAMCADRPLSVTVESRVLPDCTVVIDIRDDGAGIKALDLPRVLEPGFGKGLGIALKNVDDRLKGHFGPGSGLAVESVEGSGTTVSLTMAQAAGDGSMAEC